MKTDRFESLGKTDPQPVGPVGARSRAGNSTYLCAGYGLSIDSQVSEQFRIDEDLYAATGFRCLAPLVSAGMITSMGQIEFAFLQSSGLIFYDDRPLLAPRAAPDALASLGDFMFRVRVFINSLWFVKDNAVNCELTFLEDWPPVGDVGRHSNALSFLFSDSQGSARSVSAFSKSELEAAIVAYRAVKAFGSVGRASAPTANAARLSRFWRAHLFLQAARFAGDVGTKIAQYCSAWEALFASDSAELTHKLAERVAFFLSSTAPERQRTYGIVKAAYSVRSKVVHGVGAGQTNEQLAPVSRQCDELTRQLMTKILGNPRLLRLFSGDGNFDEFVMAIVFGDAEWTAVLHPPSL